MQNGPRSRTWTAAVDLWHVRAPMRPTTAWRLQTVCCGGTSPRGVVSCGGCRRRHRLPVQRSAGVAAGWAETEAPSMGAVPVRQPGASPGHGGQGFFPVANVSAARAEGVAARVACLMVSQGLLARDAVEIVFAGFGCIVAADDLQVHSRECRPQQVCPSPRAPPASLAGSLVCGVPENAGTKRVEMACSSKRGTPP